MWRETVAFRVWRRPTVKAGGRLRTALGEIAIDSVERHEIHSISDRGVFAAGYGDRRMLLADLGRRVDDNSTASASISTDPIRASRRASGTGSIVRRRDRSGPEGYCG